MTQSRPGTIRIAASQITKSFGATCALSGADLEVRAGEVHTVMGENGSGKSTLMKILSGVHRPDEGRILVDGGPADHMRSPADARTLGISTVFQEVLTVPGQTILANVWVGSRGAGLTRATRRARAGEVLARLLGHEVDVDAPIESLSLSGRQAACIARSLVQDPSLLILDESTSALDVATRDRLFGLVRESTARGNSALFISHRMDEVFEVSDVFTVLRAGQTVGSRLNADTTSPGELVKLMSGVDATITRRVSSATAQAVLTADDVVVAPGSPAISMTLHEGALVGLAGLEGQGQEAFLSSLRGVATVSGTVTRHVRGVDEIVTDPVRARALGIGFVPRERRRQAMFEPLSIRENFGLPTLRHDARWGLVSHRRTTARLTELASLLRVKMGHPRDLITTLSGGNQQKVILARTLADTPAVLLLNDPTRGIDQNAKHDVYATLERLCSQGVAVVVLSSEVDELVRLADRVLVFKDGSVSADLAGERVSRDNIVAAYFGAPQTSGSAGGTSKGSSDVHHAPATR